MSSIEALFMQLATKLNRKKDSQKKLSERLRGIGHAPAGFDYKKELEKRFV
jgi:hypothetical protein